MKLKLTAFLLLLSLTLLSQIKGIAQSGMGLF